jgi:hypothetical protein
MSERSPELSREELGATLAARHELGAEFEPALVDSLAERVETAIESRVQARLAHQVPATPPPPAVPAMHPGLRLGMGLGSIGLAIPCTAIAGDVAQLPGVIVVWAGVVLVNVAFNLGGRR